MTKAELVGAAYIKLTGGYPNTDASTWFEDVELLLAPAVNYVMNADYFISKRDEGDEKIIQPLFLQTYRIRATLDQDSRKYKATLPRKPLALPKNRAVPYVGTLYGEQFVPIEQSGGVMQKYFSFLKQAQASYELEGQDLYFHNLPPVARNGDILVKMIVSVASLDDDDEIILPEGGEIQVINLLLEFFLGQRQLPKDYYNTNKEPNIQA